MYVCECAGVHISWHVCRGQFSPSTMWVLGTKLSLSRLVASALFAEPSCWPSNIYFKLKSF